MACRVGHQHAPLGSCLHCAQHKLLSRSDLNGWPGDPLFVHNGLANRCQCNARQFQVLKAKRYADDGDETQQGRKQMPDGQPQSGKDKPDDVAHQTQAAGSNVVLIGQGFAADSVFTERQKGKLTNHKASPGPRDAHNGDGTQEPGQPPTQPHEEATQNEPEDVANKAQDGFL